MPHHFNKQTVQASVFCRTCGRETPHYVADGRLGRCMNDHHVNTPAIQKVDSQISLFATKESAEPNQLEGAL